MSDSRSDALTLWYKQRAPFYTGLIEVVTTTISKLMKARNIDFLAVGSRTKSFESVIEKIDRKEYSSPEEVTDLAGIRIITYIETDIEKVGKLLGKAFRLHANKSLNKSEELGADQMGYRSVHFVCELGKNRTKLPEFAVYQGLIFEVQVRTVLQHAWAEIEHDRNYKFTGVLPTPIGRRLYLLAGMLEIVDREFVSLAKEVDAYTREIKTIAKSGELGKVEITSLSLREFLKTKSDMAKDVVIKVSADPSFEVVVKELNQFGAMIIDDLDALFNPEFLATANQTVKTTTQIGLFRKAMMYADLERYFDRSWGEKWREMNSSTRHLLNRKYGSERLEAILARHGINQKALKRRKN
jgi:putative GTP pyrophosphokinase